MKGKRAPKKPTQPEPSTSTTPRVTRKRAPKVPTLECRFYKTNTGKEPVREWLKNLPADVRKEIGSDVQVVQWRWPVGMPLVDGFGDGLFEVRTTLDGNIYRVLFCLDGSTLVLLHGFTKKSQKTPQADITRGRKRQKEVEDES